MVNFGVSGRLLCDLELLLNGAFNPLTGFLKQEDYNGVVNDMRLSSGEVWPIPIVFPIKKSEKGNYENEEFITLTDPTSLPLAKLYIEEIYEPDLDLECEKVLGSTDPNHPYHSEIKKHGETLYIGGRVEKINLPFHFDFKQIRKRPEQVKEEIKKAGLTKVVGFQTRNPMHKCHYELVKYAMKQLGEASDIGCLIHPVVGVTQDCDIEYFHRVRCYQRLMPKFPEGKAILSLLPLSMRMAGPREALLHALVRKNYGCTHFIVGRDHAGPSYKKQNGEKFYGDYDAHNLLESVKDEIGISVIVSKAIMYVNELKEYRPADEIEEGQTTQHISGTEQRKLLREGKDIPEWFSFPEVVSELKQIYKPNYKKGICFYLIGLSGSGKSMTASVLNDKLRSIYSKKNITVLDGDVIRTHLSKGLGFSREDRSQNVRRIGYVASEIVKHGGIVICSNIAPFDEDRLFNRKLISQHGGYIEVHISTSLSKCEERDCKGLYKLARDGKIPDFTGISSPFEAPTQGDLILESNSVEDLEINVDKIVDYLTENDYIPK